MKKLLSVIIAAALMASGSYTIAAPATTTGFDQGGTAGVALRHPSGLSAGATTAVEVSALLPLSLARR